MPFQVTDQLVCNHLAAGFKMQIIAGLNGNLTESKEFCKKKLAWSPPDALSADIRREKTLLLIALLFLVSCREKWNAATHLMDNRMFQSDCD